MKGLLLMSLFAVIPAFAGAPGVYTNDDLEKYEGRPTYDQETVTRTETELKQWEREKEADERVQKEKRGAAEIREEGQKPAEQAGSPRKTKRT